jgi:hypothetical protein
MFLGCKICVSVFHKFAKCKLTGSDCILSSLHLILFSIQSFNFVITFSNKHFFLHKTFIWLHNYKIRYFRLPSTLETTNKRLYISIVLHFYSCQILSDIFGFWKNMTMKFQRNILAGCQVQFTIVAQNSWSVIRGSLLKIINIYILSWIHPISLKSVVLISKAGFCNCWNLLGLCISTFQKC